ncbi:hypothetical protein [Paratractidigestivibacter sp.]|uniref:hypothetical protein n=1 Tax=Paratractidigestivibacter sp. TaxID=2847316 RepID=UPI002ABD1B66|nr:hypothetical protein [Paratractidigestivibacter sp.]
MTLIITAVAAIAAAGAWYATRSEHADLHLGVLALMYAGAALMWCVDGFASLAESGPFVELSDADVMADDAKLGALIVVCGLAIWGVYLLVRRRRTACA